MKKIYAILSATLLTGFAGYGQVEIREFSGGVAIGNDISGTTYPITINDANHTTAAVTFSVKNVSGVATDYKIMRLRLNTMPGWTDGLCWGPYPDPSFVGQCYGAGQMQTNPWTTPNTAPLPVDGSGNIVVDIYTAESGSGLYRYYVMAGNTTVDSIDVEVSSVLGLNDPEPAEARGMTAYPNPANAQLTVNTTGVDGMCTVRITDVLGKVVYNEEGTATKKIDVSDFKNGVYLVTVLEKGVAIQTRRVVVKH